MIKFRCWYCHRYYAVPDNRARERFVCGCKNPLRVPRRSGGNCRVKTLVDRLVETVVCGGGGALLGLGLALLILSQLPGLLWLRRTWMILAGFTTLGFLAGFFGGERGIEWLGRIIREREKES
jgi:hypothetical protein